MNRLLVLLLMLLVVLAPLPLGSNREWSWTLCALLAAGRRTFRRTTQRNEPRGVFCALGRCTDCVMIVDGQPNVRTCVTPASTRAPAMTPAATSDVRTVLCLLILPPLLPADLLTFSHRPKLRAGARRSKSILSV